MLRHSSYTHCDIIVIHMTKSRLWLGELKSGPWNWTGCGGEVAGIKTSIFTDSEASIHTWKSNDVSIFFFFQFQITPEYHDFCPIAVLNLYLLWLLLAYQLPNLTFIFNPGLDLLGASISPGHSHQLRTHSFFLPDTYSLFISVPQPHCVLILYVWVLDFGISISAMVIFCSCFDYIQMDGS